MNFKDDTDYYDYDYDDDDGFHFELAGCKLSPAMTCSNKE